MAPVHRSPGEPISTIYSKALYGTLNEGLALWYPEPHRETGEVQIGDVGYVSDGAFIRLVNVDTESPSHAVREGCWPSSFSPTAPDPRALMHESREHALGPGDLSSKGVEKNQGSITTQA
jgi:hypothetical protein